VHAEFNLFGTLLSEMKLTLSREKKGYPCMACSKDTFGDGARREKKKPGCAKRKREEGGEKDGKTTMVTGERGDQV
jgi:hypothetical protein